MILAHHPGEAVVVGAVVVRILKVDPVSQTETTSTLIVAMLYSPTHSLTFMI